MGTGTSKNRHNPAFMVLTIGGEKDPHSPQRSDRETDGCALKGRGSMTNPRHGSCQGQARATGRSSPGQNVCPPFPKPQMEIIPRQCKNRSEATWAETRQRVQGYKVRGTWENFQGSPRNVAVCSAVTLLCWRPSAFNTEPSPLSTGRTETRPRHRGSVWLRP